MLIELSSRHHLPTATRYPAIRAILAAGAVGTTFTRSELEERFLRFVAHQGLPRPELNVPIALRGGFVEVDCVWRRARLIAELDGRAVHGTAAAFERDRSRDRALSAAGWRVVRITWRQLSEVPRELAADIGVLLAGDARLSTCIGRSKSLTVGHGIGARPCRLCEMRHRGVGRSLRLALS